LDVTGKEPIINVSEVMHVLDHMIPPFLAEDWDNCGLQVGSPSWEVQDILVSLNPSIEALEEAIRLRANLIITHHPLLFSPLHKVDLSTNISLILAKALESGVAILSVHTNWDRLDGGVSDALARSLGIDVTGFLEEGPGERMAKLVVFTPPEAKQKVREVLFDAYTGVIGRYSHCSFALKGEGSYLPLEGSHPYVGEPGGMEKADEFRLEVIVPRAMVKKVLTRLKHVHPYEEVAYDVYPLLNPTHRGGMGRIGTLPAPMKVKDLISLIKDKLKLDMVKFAGNGKKQVNTVALCGGAGSGLWKTALAKGAQVYISGEFNYHAALEARSLGMTLVDIGHFASEFPAVKELAQKLGNWLSGKDGINIYTYNNEKDVFEFV